MKTKISIFLVLIVILQILAGCNEQNTYKKDVLQQWEKTAGNGYSVYVFMENKPMSNDVETITKLKKYASWSGFYTYRYIDDQTKIDYLNVFNEKSYPFYLIVSKNGIVLKTASVNDVVHFFEKNGGSIKATNGS